jgi:hypothetical protein
MGTSFQPSSPFHMYDDFIVAIKKRYNGKLTSYGSGVHTTSVEWDNGNIKIIKIFIFLVAFFMIVQNISEMLHMGLFFRLSLSLWWVQKKRKNINSTLATTHMLLRMS